MGVDSLAFQARESLLFGPILSLSGKDLWEEPHAGLLGFGDGERTLPSLRAESPRSPGWWDTGNTPIPHANTPAIGRQPLTPHNFTCKPLGVPASQSLAPAPSSAGPDTGKQSSLAEKAPCASPRRNAEGRILSEIISLILNEALLPQLPVSPPGYCRQ